MIAQKKKRKYTKGKHQIEDFGAYLPKGKEYEVAKALYRKIKVYSEEECRLINFEAQAKEEEVQRRKERGYEE